MFTLAQRREIKKIAKSAPADHGLPFSRWSLSKLAEFLVAEGVVEDISHEGLRALLAAEGVSFQAVKTWKASRDLDYAAKKARVEHLYAIADGEAAAGPGGPGVIFCVDEFGPLNLQPRPGRQWARRGGTAREPGEGPRRRRRATYTRTKGVRHLFAALELGSDKMYGAHQEAQAARRVPGVLPLPARPASAGRADRDRLRQLQPAPDDQEGQARRPVGRRQQRRDRLHAHELFVEEPHRVSVHRVARVHPERHRPRHPPRTGPHDPPLHRLAEPPHQ